MTAYRCACVNVGMGTYENQVPLHPPFPVRGGVVGIDRCIADEIQALWALGIETCNSCCGHNTVLPMIIVAEADEARMEALDYSDWRHNDARMFYPKSVPELLLFEGVAN